MELYITAHYSICNRHPDCDGCDTCLEYDPEVTLVISDRERMTLAETTVQIEAWEPGGARFAYDDDSPIDLLEDAVLTWLVERGIDGELTVGGGGGSDDGTTRYLRWSLDCASHIVIAGNLHAIDSLRASTTISWTVEEDEYSGERTATYHEGCIVTLEDDGTVIEEECIDLSPADAADETQQPIVEALDEWLGQWGLTTGEYLYPHGGSQTYGVSTGGLVFGVEVAAQ